MIMKQLYSKYMLPLPFLSSLQSTGSPNSYYLQGHKYTQLSAGGVHAIWTATQTLTDEADDDDDDDGI